MNFVDELKRRKVFKVGAAYLVVAWLAVQAVSIGFPAFDAPPWALRVFILLAMLGFPIALVFAWMFDMTPDGVRAEGGSARRTIGVYVVAAALAGLALGWYFKGQPSYRVGDVPAGKDPSVAVLPFVNMSGKSDEEYFFDGMTEELLNVLAKIPKLNVAAREAIAKARGGGATIFFIARSDVEGYNSYNASLGPVMQAYYFANLVGTANGPAMLRDARTREALTRYGFVAYWREKGWPAVCRPLGSDDFECGTVAKN